MSEFGHRVNIIDGFMAVSSTGISDIHILRGEENQWTEFLRINKSGYRFGDAMDFDHAGRLISGRPFFKKNGNSVGEAYIHFLKPVTPVNLIATDGRFSSSIEIDWRREIGRDGFRVYERGTEQALDVIESSNAAGYAIQNLASGEIKELGVSSFK